MIHQLNHVSIKTGDLERSVRFYTDVIGLEVAYRPDFGFPGAWLGAEGAALIHLYAGEPARQPDGSAFRGSAAVDHFALTARGFADYRRRFAELKLDWREQVIAEIHVWQLFVYDPDGVMVELNFDGSDEPGLPPDNASERRYIPGENFYRAPVSAL